MGVTGLLVLLLTITSTAEAAPEGARASVISGSEAAPGSFPYMAFVVIDNGSEVDLCSGTVVSTNVVLTAAHCVMNSTFSVLRNPANVSVVTGDVDWASSQRTVSSVSRLAVDPNLAWLTPSYTVVRGDAAVLQLSAPVSAPAVRLAATRTWTSGTSVVMVGWGRTTPNGEPPETLHVGESAIQTSSYCSSKFSRFESSALLCAVDYPDYRYAACHGDSGGPLLMTAPGTTDEPLEVGITSFGDEECSTESPQFFTRADYVASWVDQKIAEWAASTTSPPPARTAPAASTPAPTASSPKLPKMSSASAKAYARRGLAEGLRYRFNRRSAYRIRCAEAKTTAQKCRVRWYSLAYYYYGTITVFFTSEGGRVVWNDRYRIRRIPNRCHRRCRPVVFRR